MASQVRFLPSFELVGIGAAIQVTSLADECSVWGTHLARWCVRYHDDHPRLFRTGNHTVDYANGFRQQSHRVTGTESSRARAHKNTATNLQTTLQSTFHFSIAAKSEDCTDMLQTHQFAFLLFTMRMIEDQSTMKAY